MRIPNESLVDRFQIRYRTSGANLINHSSPMEGTDTFTTAQVGKAARRMIFYIIAEFLRMCVLMAYGGGQPVKK